MKKTLLIFCSALLISIAIALGVLHQVKAQSFAPDPVMEKVLTRFKTDLPQFQLKAPLQSPDFQQYLDFYSLNYKNTQHYAGALPVKTKGFDERIFVHYFAIQNPKATVLMMHGYFVHSGMMKYAIEDALKQGYAVVAIDLPGHGLSTGRSASIKDFKYYSDVLKIWTQQYANQLTQPLFLLGHSTGGAAMIDYTLRYPKHPYKKMVLAAPLVRSYLWDLSQVGHFMGSSFINELPRYLRETTKEPSFIEFVTKDPLQYPATPIEWVSALIDWNTNTLPKYTINKTPLLMLQGDQDTVVEWPYNLEFLKKKYAPFQSQIIKGAKHDLFWERPEIRQVLWNQTWEFFSEAQKTGVQ